MRFPRLGFILFAGLIGTAAAQTPVLPTTATTTTTPASAVPVFTSTQQVAIEKVVHDYLLAHPEILLEAGQALQMKQQALMQEKANKVIPTLITQLLHHATSPAAGNKAGTVSVVEFYDLQCQHCKSMAPEITALLAQNKDVRVIYKELPIFGPDSVFAAKAELASQKQGKFEVFHNALLTTHDRLTNQTVLDIAKSVGLDINKLQAESNLPEYNKELQENMALAQQIGIAGTPGFIIISVDKAGKVKSQFIPGQTTAADLANAAKAVK